MSLVKFSNGIGVPRTFSDMLDRFFDDELEFSGNTFAPSVDISETGKSYEIELSLPGMNKKDFNLEVEDNVLTISGDRKLEKEDKNKTYHRVESQYGSFSRSFNLPEDAKSGDISASYENGILKVRVPKDIKKTKSRKINIQ